jgi:hypothetical protein
VVAYVRTVKTGSGATAVQDRSVFRAHYDAAVRDLLESARRAGQIGGQDRAKVLRRQRRLWRDDSRS